MRVPAHTPCPQLPSPSPSGAPPLQLDPYQSRVGSLLLLPPLCRATTSSHLSSISSSAGRMTAASLPKSLPASPKSLSTVRCEATLDVVLKKPSLLPTSSSTTSPMYWFPKESRSTAPLPLTTPSRSPRPTSRPPLRSGVCQLATCC